MRAVLFRTLIDPGAQEANLLAGERGEFGPLVFGRHFHFLDEVGREQDQRAFGALAGDDHRVFAFAAFEQRCAAAHLKFAFGFVRPVAFAAGILDDGFDVLREAQIFFRGRGSEFAGIDRSDVCGHVPVRPA